MKAVLHWKQGWVLQAVSFIIDVLQWMVLYHQDSSNACLRSLLRRCMSIGAGEPWTFSGAGIHGQS